MNLDEMERRLAEIASWDGLSPTLVTLRWNGW